MFRFPFYGYPYNYPYYKYYNNQNANNNQNTQTKKEEEKNSITNSNKISNTINPKNNSDNEQAIFEILGIKLYLDDIIILGILFFLYKEEVKDEMLYIILFLLLFA